MDPDNSEVNYPDDYEYSAEEEAVSKLKKKSSASELSFITLSEAYAKSYDSQKPQLLQEIDKVLDDYLSFTVMEAPVIITEHDGSDEKDT
jgi:hypothetical protein